MMKSVITALLFGLTLVSAGAARADDHDQRQDWHRDFGNHSQTDHHDSNGNNNNSNGNSGHNQQSNSQTDGSSRLAYQRGYQDGLTGHSHRGDHADGSVESYTDGFQAGLKQYNQRDGYNYSRGYGRSDRHDYAYGSAYPDRQSNVVIVNPRDYQDQYGGQPGYYVQPYGSRTIPNSALQSRTYYYSNGYGAYQ